MRSQELQKWETQGVTLTSVIIKILTIIKIKQGRQVSGNKKKEMTQLFYHLIVPTTKLFILPKYTYDLHDWTHFWINILYVSSIALIVRKFHIQVAQIPKLNLCDLLNSVNTYETVTWRMPRAIITLYMGWTAGSCRRVATQNTSTTRWVRRRWDKSWKTWNSEWRTHILASSQARGGSLGRNMGVSRFGVCSSWRQSKGEWRH